MAGGPDDLPSLLWRSGVLQNHLAPKLTTCQLLLVSQVCRQYRHSLRHDDVWRSAVRRSLPPGYPLTHSSTAGYRQTAYQYGRIQSSIKGGSAVLRCGTVLPLPLAPRPSTVVVLSLWPKLGSRYSSADLRAYAPGDVLFLARGWFRSVSRRTGHESEPRLGSRLIHPVR